MQCRNADFSCHAARRGAPTTARGRVRCAVAISTWNDPPEPAKFYFNEPEPNLNHQNCAQVNPNRT